MYVCMYVCMCVCMFAKKVPKYLCVYINTHTHFLCLCIYAAYIHIYICIHAYIHKHAYIYRMRALHSSKPLIVHERSYIILPLHTYTFTFACMHTYTSMHIQDAIFAFIKACNCSWRFDTKKHSHGHLLPRKGIDM